MIPLSERIEAFDWLGQYLTQLPNEALSGSIAKAMKQNPWFNDNSIRAALEATCKNLKADVLERWVAPYYLKDHDPIRVGVIMAGNIPLVGFHDFLTVLISGNRIVVKLSSQDNVLLPQIADYLIKQFPQFKEYISFKDGINNVDVAIATGSDNSARHFQYYLKDIPRIIRKNRSSVGIIGGDENHHDIASLGKDIFTYFGLGCRNISKLLVPKNYNVEELTLAWKDRQEVLQQPKYANNYRYHKAGFAMNGQEYFDNGLLLSIEKEEVIAPVGVLHYQLYEDQSDLVSKLQDHRHKTQCLASRGGRFPGSIAFGQTQHPHLWDYADQVDTLKFLSNKLF